MKLIILLCFLMFSFNVFSQKWHLEKINKHEKYKFEYWIQFDNKRDSSSFQLHETKDVENSLFSITDNFGEPIQFASILLQGESNDASINLVTDERGKASAPLLNGKYSVEIHALTFDGIKLMLDLNEESQTYVNARLGKGSEDEVYQLNSKFRLSEKEINGIIKCIEENKSDAFDRCSQLKRFQILMHI